MNKYFFFIFCFFLPSLLCAQTFNISGNIVIEEVGGPEGARIIIHRNNEKIEEKNITKKGKFDLKLALGADYKLSFEKNGYITKIVNINTEVPDEIVETNPDFPPVKLIINLLPVVEEVDLSIFEQPIAILAYDYELDDFNFDKEYSAKIRERVAQTELKVKRVLEQKGSEALAKEKMFNDLVAQGENEYTRKQWQNAIENWTKALGIKPEEKVLKEKIAIAKQEYEREMAQKAIEAQNARTYKLLVTSGDSLFALKKYGEAREKYVAALNVNSQEAYPSQKITEIDRTLAELAKAEKDATEKKALEEKYKHLIAEADLLFGQKNYDDAEPKYKEALALNFEKTYPETQIKAINDIRRQEAERLKQETALNARYDKIIASADQEFQNKTYETSIKYYQQALEVKPSENYPKEMIAKAEAEIVALKQQQEAEAERQRQEALQKAELMKQYKEIVAKADLAFKSENYSIARTHYTEADQLNTGEVYPKNQIKAIDNVLNSAKYKQRLAEFNQNKELAEKSLAAKNYAGAKVYYQKALAILPIDGDAIRSKIEEIDKLIEAEQLAAIQKEYNKHITKADKAYQEKSYAIAKFYYQKALEVKKGDKYAQGQLAEVEKHINERSEKTMEL